MPKFITENKLEHNKFDNDVILFVPNYLIDDWCKLLGANILDDEGIECRMKDGYFCYMMDDITAYYGIEMHEIFNEATK